jgi:hypothetical protein
MQPQVATRQRGEFGWIVHLDGEAEQAAVKADSLVDVINNVSDGGHAAISHLR